MRAVGSRRSMRGRTAAAVAVILRPLGDDLAVLFIRRPRRSGDRWSGDLAFPGGLARPGEDPASAARREALEEVGLALGDAIGRLDDRLTAHPHRARPMRVRPILFVTEQAHDARTTARHADGLGHALRTDPREVAEAFWVPLSRLSRLPIVPTVQRVWRLPLVVPSLDLDGRALWGLTLAMVRELRREICTPEARPLIMRA